MKKIVDFEICDIVPYSNGIIFAKKEMLEKCDEGVVKKFLKSMVKQATKEGTMGIKKLSGKGIKGFMYEVKVMGKGGAYRLLGNKTENGEIFWEVFEKTHK